ncbi:transposase [Peterkaempfera bronchialis]|uniref:transposase n=1 Tax=Peterkaempfera bronchialis TaxID=2126346 RepID=UPI00389ADF88
MLPGRTVETVRSGLAAHPGVKVICRDRSALHAEAGRLGAPDAIHVADRFHLWQNLADAVEKTVLQHRSLLPEPPLPAGPTQPVSLPPAAAEPRRTLHPQKPASRMSAGSPLPSPLSPRARRPGVVGRNAVARVAPTAGGWVSQGWIGPDDGGSLAFRAPICLGGPPALRSFA